MDNKKRNRDDAKAVLWVFVIDLVIFSAIMGYVYFIRMGGK